MCMYKNQAADKAFWEKQRITVYKWFIARKNRKGNYICLKTPVMDTRIRLGTTLFPVIRNASRSLNAFEAECIHAYVEKKQAIHSGYRSQQNSVLLKFNVSLSDVLAIGYSGQIALSRLDIPKEITPDMVVK